MGAKRILINDTDATLVANIKGILEQQGLSFDVIVTGDGAEALEIVRRLPVDLVITGLHTPTLDGFQLLVEINRHHRTVKVIMMVDPMTLLPRATFRYLGADATYRKPVDPPEIVEAVFAELQIRTKGEVWGIRLTSFLQMLNADVKTCSLTVTTQVQAGRIFISDGELIAAEDGTQVGDDAMYSILGWDDPIIEIDYLPFTKEPNISSGLMRVLLEAQRRKDTNAMEALQLRRHTRFNCLVAVDYDLKDGSYRHLIRDMSEGGAYIESRALVTIGDEMEMTVFSLKHRQNCVIRGKIVRRGFDGFGVQFLQMDDVKRDFLRALRGT